MNESALNKFEYIVNKNNLNVYGIHLYLEDEGSCELRFRSNDRVHLFSGSKAFASMAVGIAEGEKLIKLSESALSFFPQFKHLASPGAEKITIKDLLQMRAGHKAPLFTSEEQSQERVRDWAELFFVVGQLHPAGTSFLYDNGCTYMLSRIIEAVSGKTLRDYLMPRLFEPLGIYNPQWHTCPGGHSLGAIGLYLNTEEFSRLGIMMLNGGTYNDRQIVPRGYIKRASSDIVAAEGFSDEENMQGYGYKLWRCTVPGAFRADGKFGQYCVVLPVQRAVVTITAHNESNAYDILRAVWEGILPQIS